MSGGFLLERIVAVDKIDKRVLVHAELYRLGGVFYIGCAIQ